MEHNDQDQRSISDMSQQNIEPNSPVNDNTSNSLLPTLLIRLGLERSSLSEEAKEEPLREVLSNPVWTVRIEALRICEKLGKHAPVELLVSSLNDENGFVRAAAARALGKLGNTASTEPLMTALQDTEWRVRAAASLALGDLREKVSLEPLVVALSDEDESVRAAAASALGALRERAAIEPLVVALGDPVYIVRESTALALGELGEQVPIGPLMSALKDRDVSVREAVKLALQQTHPEVYHALESNLNMSPFNDEIVITLEERTQNHPGKIEGELGIRQQVSLNGHNNTDFAFKQVTSINCPGAVSPQEVFHHTAASQSVRNKKSLHINQREQPASSMPEQPVQQRLRSILQAYWSSISAYLSKKLFYIVNPYQLEDRADSDTADFLLGEEAVQHSRQPIRSRVWQTVNIIIAWIIIACILFASVVLFQRPHTTTGSVMHDTTTLINETPEVPAQLSETKVYPSNLSPSQCRLTGQSWICQVLLAVPSISTGKLNWSASSNLLGVTFSHPSGALSLSSSTISTTVQITISVPISDCFSGVFTFTFTFMGALKTDNVRWNCS
jgi:hypothetical protein